MAAVPLVRSPPNLPNLSPARNSEARSAAQQFEAVFVGEMTKIMLDTIPTDDRFGGGNAQSIYSGMLAEEMGKAIAQKGGIGIAPKVLDEIIRMQGNQHDR